MSRSAPAQTRPRTRLAVVGATLVAIGLLLAFGRELVGHITVGQDDDITTVEQALGSTPATVEERAATSPEPQRTPAITTPSQVPFAAGTFPVADLYQGPVGSLWYLVYAGAQTQSGGSAHGAVRIYREAADDSVTPVGTFPAPGVCADLRATGASGVRLALTCDTGRHLTFDLGSLRYA